MRRLDTVVEQLRRHVEASARRDYYARRAIDLLALGEEQAGYDAADRAELWDLRAKALEPVR
jgi:hypothetical protein